MEAEIWMMWKNDQVFCKGPNMLWHNIEINMKWFIVSLFVSSFLHWSLWNFLFTSDFRSFLCFTWVFIWIFYSPTDHTLSSLWEIVTIVGEDWIFSSMRNYDVIKIRLVRISAAFPSEMRKRKLRVCSCFLLLSFFTLRLLNSWILRILRILCVLSLIQ